MQVLGPVLTNCCSIQFNIVCKHLGAERMSFYLNEAAGDVRDMLLPSLQPPKAKL
jgi:carnitine O-acetyltransferase